MELLEQCRAWHKAGDFMKIVSTIEALPEKDLTPDLEFELARAYNHVGMTTRPIDTDWFVKAVALLLKLRPILGETHDWHLRAGHAMFSLDTPGPALLEFRLALATFPEEADPDLLDASREGIATLIELCRDTMYRPRRPYAMRAATAWLRFRERRPELERLLLTSFEQQAFQPARRALEEFLGDAVPGAFEFGRDKGRFEVVFPLSRPRSHLSIIEHFIKMLPEEAGDEWVFHAGRRPRTDFRIGVDHRRIDAADVLCSLEPAKGDEDGAAPEGRYDMTLYCPALIVGRDGGGGASASRGPPTSSTSSTTSRSARRPRSACSTTSGSRSRRPPTRSRSRRSASASSNSATRPTTTSTTFSGNSRTTASNQRTTPGPPCAPTS